MSIKGLIIAILLLTPWTFVIPGVIYLYGHLKNRKK